MVGIAPRPSTGHSSFQEQGAGPILKASSWVTCWRLPVLSLKVSNGSTEIGSPVQFFFQLYFPGSMCDYPIPWHGGLCLAMGLPLQLFGPEGYRGTGNLLLYHLPPPPPLLPGAASGKQDEEPPAVPSHPLRGDDHCHHPVHQPGCPGVPALRGGHSGQHNTQPAQLLVSPCGELKDWGVPDREVGEGVAGDSLRELIWVSMRIAVFAKLQGVRQGLSDV